MKPADPFTFAEMLGHARSAIDKVDARGERGAEKVTHEEIIAMCTLLVTLGLATEAQIKGDKP